MKKNNFIISSVVGALSVKHLPRTVCVVGEGNMESTSAQSACIGNIPVVYCSREKDIPPSNSHYKRASFSASLASIALVAGGNRKTNLPTYRKLEGRKSKKIV